MNEKSMRKVTKEELFKRALYEAVNWWNQMTAEERDTNKVPYHDARDRVLDRIYNRYVNKIIKHG